MDQPVEILDGRGPGAPTAYKQEFCEQLVRHMANGGSFEAFAGVAGVTYQTLYDWRKRHPEFAEAKKLGDARSRNYWEQVGRGITLGQLTVVSREEPVFDKDGKVVLDGNGNVVMRKEYEPAKVNATTWIFTMKNMHGWRDRRDISLIDPSDTGRPLQEVEREKLVSRVKHMMDKAMERHERKRLTAPPKQG